MTRVLAFVLVGAFALPSSAVAQSDVSWEDLQAVPANSQVRLTLRSGPTPTGLLRRVGSEDVVLRLPSPSTLGLPADPGSYRRDTERRFLRTEVSSIELRRVALEFRADGRPDPVQVGLVVRALGTGRDVRVRTTAGEKIRGHIFAIGDEGFSVLRRRDENPERVAFGDVAEIKPPSYKLLTGVVVGASAFFLVVWNAMRLEAQN